MHLAVPVRRQLGDGYCLPACVEMVLTSLVPSKGRSIQQTEGPFGNQASLARALGTVPDVGTPISAVTSLTARIRQLRALNITFHPNGEPEDLERALDRGIPPILRVITGQLPYWSENTPHAVVLVGLQEGIATVNDPAFDEPQHLSFGDLCLAWDNGGYNYVLIQ